MRLAKSSKPPPPPASLLSPPGGLIKDLRYEYKEFDQV